MHVMSQFCSCGSLIDEMTGTSGGSRITFFIFAQVTAQELLKTKNTEGERHTGPNIKVDVVGERSESFFPDPLVLVIIFCC